MKSIKQYAKVCVAIMGLATPGVSMADLLNCGIHSIKSIYIQGNRDDSNPHANNIMAVLDGNLCNGNNLVYIENVDPNSSAILSGLMTAYTAGMRVGFYVNTSKTIAGGTQIAIIKLVK